MKRCKTASKLLIFCAACLMALGAKAQQFEALQETALPAISKDKKYYPNFDPLKFTIRKAPAESFTFYDPSAKTLYLSAQNDPAATKAFYYKLDLADKKAEPLNADETSPDIPSENLFLVDKSYNVDTHNLRQTSQHFRKKLDQPFGSSKIEVILEEETFKYQRPQLLGLELLANKKTLNLPAENMTEETYGKGILKILLLKDNISQIIYSESFENNNQPFTIYWTPDGRHIVMEGRQNARGEIDFTIFGPLPSFIDEDNIIMAVGQYQKYEAYMNGAISPEDYFGETYKNALQRIKSCTKLKTILGAIQNIQLKSKEPTSIQGTDTGSLGLNFDFFVTGEKGKGILNVSAFHDPDLAENQDYQDLIESMLHLKFKGEDYHFDENCKQVGEL